MGAHVIKVGLTPILMDLLERGVVTAVALNGACAVHDFELATAGFTSEDVETQLAEGEFGMAEETGRVLNEAVGEGVRRGVGFGRAVGELAPPDRAATPLSSASSRPARDSTCPVRSTWPWGPTSFTCTPAATGPRWGGEPSGLPAAGGRRGRPGDGGVYLNVGSAVLLPEVFLKALTLARNLGHRVQDFVTANLDFIQHYRPTQNVVRRPVASGGRGYALTGHHELLVPLLAAAVIEGMER